MDQRHVGQSQYWKTIIDTMAEALMVVDHRGVIVSVNQSMLDLTGFTEKELVGKPCAVLNCDTCAVKKSRSPEHFCALFEQKRLNIRCTLRKKNGQAVDILKNATVLKDGQGKIIGGVETLTDLSEALAMEKMITTLRQELRARDGFQSIIGASAPMRRVFDLITSVAKSDSPVIIYGESGTGKELVANAIHNLGARRKGPFVKLNCAALNESLLESELFGHVKGAFTGAFKTRIGRFEAADKGDFFLDEIGDIPLSVQVKLLRVLEDKRIEKVGDNRSLAVDVRTISATHRNLKQMISKGEFREDFFYRIGVLPIHMPPLRERKEDIPLLVTAFIDRIRLKTGKPVSGISKAALELLYDYDWPGNIRELINLIEFAFVLCDEGEIKPVHLPATIMKMGKPRSMAALPFLAGEPAERNAKQELLSALDATGGNKSEAAKMLGISRVALYKRLKRYNVHIEQTVRT